MKQRRDRSYSAPSIFLSLHKSQRLDFVTLSYANQKTPPFATIAVLHERSSTNDLF